MFEEGRTHFCGWLDFSEDSYCLKDAQWLRMLEVVSPSGNELVGRGSGEVAKDA